MKTFFAGALVVALLGVPMSSPASTATTPGAPVAPAPPYYLARPAESGPAPASDDATQYAAREQAAPHLGEFAGGNDGVYIGSGALVVAIVVLVLLLVL